MELTAEEIIDRKHLLENLNKKVARILDCPVIRLEKTNVEANLTASLGNCRQDFYGCTGIFARSAEIHISKYIRDEEQLMNTMLHELCHAYAPKGANHGPKWQKIARKVGDAFGITIARLATKEETAIFKAAIPKQKVVAKLVCKKCGNVIEIHKKGKIYKDEGIGYICNCKDEHGKACGGYFDFIRIN